MMPYMRRPTLSPTEETSRAVLSKLMQVLDLTDSAVGDKLGVSHQAIQQRRTGFTRIRSGDEERLAEVLGIPADLFRQSPVEAIRWILDNRPEQVDAQSRWRMRRAIEAA